MYLRGMSRTLPSPVALRAFEAAARHLSFTRAAEEMFVTQSAISHQVRALEDELGIRLFLRLTRQLRLTEAGETLLAVLRESFDRIEETVGELRAGGAAHALRVSLTSYFAARWLTRRLGRFWALHPEIEMHLHLTNGDVDFKRMDVDLAVAWGHGNWPDLESELLVPTRIIVVCSPALLAEGPPLREIADLKYHSLLDEAGQGLWRAWLEAAGAHGVAPARIVIMDDPNVVHQAAVEGQGIALGAEALLDDEISRGLLIRPFDRRVELGGAYYVVHLPGARDRANVSAFCSWLASEARSGRSGFD